MSIEQELIDYYRKEHIQDGDITVKDLIKQFGGGRTSWIERLSGGDYPDGYEALKVRGLSGSVQWVLRRRVPISS